MSGESDFKAVLDATSVLSHDDHVTASLLVRGRFGKQYTVGVTWKKGHEADWSWQEEESWLQTEFNAERIGVEPAQLLDAAQAAIQAYTAGKTKLTA